jgi:hypothetical protein
MLKKEIFILDHLYRGVSLWLFGQSIMVGVSDGGSSLPHGEQEAQREASKTRYDLQRKASSDYFSQLDPTF